MRIDVLKHPVYTIIYKRTSCLNLSTGNGGWLSCCTRGWCVCGEKHKKKTTKKIYFCHIKMSSDYMYDKHLCCAIVSTVMTKYNDKSSETIKGRQVPMKTKQVHTISAIYCL